MEQDADQPSLRLNNVRVFDSRRAILGEPADVVVAGNRVDGIYAPGDTPTPGAREVDGRGRVLIPGLIDAHWHSSFAVLSPAQAMGADTAYIHIRAGQAAGQTLRRGFTTVRDAGGPIFGLKQAVDAGVVAGPRVFPSGAFISQSGGHGDFRGRHEVPRGCHGMLTHTEMVGVAAIADGEAEVLRAAREQLMLGASQLKVMAGGGVSSVHDPLDVTQYTEREVRAAVEAAENWGTYVMVHAYTPRAVAQALRAGVRSIEHGQLLDDETAAMIAEHDAWWDIQVFLDDEDTIPQTGASVVKQRRVLAGTVKAVELAKKYDVNLGWGSDTLFDARLADRQGAQLTKLGRWFSPAEVLRIATYQNGRLLSLSGERNPYDGPLGVIEAGALADMILVEGNPLEDLSLIEDPDRNFAMIIKDGEPVR